MVPRPVILPVTLDHVAWTVEFISLSHCFINLPIQLTVHHSNVQNSVWVSSKFLNRRPAKVVSRYICWTRKNKISIFLGSDPFTLGLKMARISMKLAIFGLFIVRWHNGDNLISLGIYGIFTCMKTYQTLWIHQVIRRKKNSWFG